MRSAIAKAVAALLIAAPLTLVAKESLGVFEGWAAFADPGARRCYAIALPLPSGATREVQPFASIGDWPAQRQRGEVYFRLGRQMRPASRISLRVGGSWYPMTGSGTHAWALDRQTNGRILAGIRSAESMTIAAFDRRGNRFTDRYPLKGVATALDAVRLACAR